ncbi:hypothetical protein PULV_a0182 [Pseudoalteromonas ulvae UL12]|nr:hypothetical protein [Pseudoalteromonas ulvae UL12]
MVIALTIIPERNNPLLTAHLKPMLKRAPLCHKSASIQYFGFLAFSNFFLKLFDNTSTGLSDFVTMGGLTARAANRCSLRSSFYEKIIDIITKKRHIPRPLN